MEQVTGGSTNQLEIQHPLTIWWSCRVQVIPSA